MSGHERLHPSSTEHEGELSALLILIITFLLLITLAQQLVQEEVMWE